MKTYRALFLFAGLGGGALGFVRARHPGARFDLAGAVDFEPSAARSFELLTGSPSSALSSTSPTRVR